MYMETILRAGPWIVVNKSLSLKPWTPTFKFDQEIMCRVPVWITLPNLDLQFWSINGLSKLASAGGIPLFTDRCKTYKERISYARVSVEVDMSSDLPECIPVCDPFGDMLNQKIE